MEHILQLGINIDDERIKNMVGAKAEKALNENVKSDVIEALTGKRDSNNWEYSRRLESLVNDTMEKFCVDNKEEIINLAANRLVEKLSRTKAAKEATEKVLKEIENK